MGPARILIVDDEPSVRALLKQLLEKNGYVCTLAPDASEARAYLGKHEFDLLLCDIRMPGESGLSLIRDVRKSHRDTGILMVTGIDDPQEAATALEVGVYGYVIKPFEPSQILISTANALRRRELEINERTYREQLEKTVQERTLNLDRMVRRLKNSQIALRQSEAVHKEQLSFMETLINAIPSPIFYKDANGRYQGCNKAFEEFTALTKAGIVGKSVYDIAPKDLADLYHEADRKLIRAPGKQAYETSVEYPDGSKHEMIFNKATYRNTKGNIAGIVGVMLDITERKRAERSLRESEELFRAMSDSAQDAIIMMDNEGKISYWNRAAEKILGYVSEAVLGDELHSLIVPERFREGFYRAFNVFQRTGNGSAVGKTIDLSAIRQGGEEFPIELSLSSVNINGAWHAVGIIRDVSSRKKGEESLRRAHTEMETMISGISSILISISGSQLIIQWNAVAERAFGICAQNVVGKPLSECGIRWELELIEEGITQCREKKETVRMDDLRFTREDGRGGFLGITLNPIQYGEGNCPGILIMGADITEKKALEMQLVQAQKLESIGNLAAGIAHEINTPIQYVGDNTRFLEGAFVDLLSVVMLYDQLRQRIEQGLTTEELIKEIEKCIQKADLAYLEKEIPTAIHQTLDGVERVSKIVRSMKEFSHPGSDEMTNVDINKALESTITVARNEWKYVAEMETDFDFSLPLVPCLPGELNQVFLNILINAAHAIGDVVKGAANGKGAIRVSTRAIDDSVEVRIRDTGSGIAEHIRSRVFDPFFTTKGVGKGTGQGLAIAHSVIVEKHCGSITFESEQGRGTTFIIRIPLNGSTS